jgi:TonB family protein
MSRMSFVISSCAIAALVATTAPAYGQNSAISVTAPKMTAAQWSETVGKSLSRNLRYAPIEWGHQGLATVRFQYGANGRPTAVALKKSSGDWYVDYAAKWAIRKLRDPPPLPAGLQSTPKVEAMPLIANSQEFYDQHMGRIRSIASERNGRLLASQGQTLMAFRFLPVGEP